MNPQYLTQEQLSKLTFNRIFNILKKTREEVRLLYMDGEYAELLAEKQAYLDLVKQVIKSHPNYESDPKPTKLATAPLYHISVPLYSQERLSSLKSSELRQHVQDIKSYMLEVESRTYNKRSIKSDLEVLSEYLNKLSHVKRQRNR